MNGNKTYILRVLYSDGSFAAILNQDDFTEPPQFSVDLNGTISEIRIKTTMTFHEWWDSPNGIITEQTLILPPEGYTGATLTGAETGAERQFNATYIGNLATLSIIEGMVETQIWSGIYTGIEIDFSNNGEENLIHLFIPNATRLATRLFRSGTLTTFTMTADPADMIKAILNSADIGITYTPDSITDLGETKTYEFKTKTCQEALEAVFGLLPSNWFYYIGGDDIFYMGTIETISARFNISMAKIKSLKVEKQISTMRNRIVFLGTTGLMQQIDSTASQNAFGIFEERLNDPGISVAADMTSTAKKILSQLATVQTNITVEILDDALSDNGFDIESIRPGDEIIIHTDKGDLSNTYWGNFTWGIDSWKYDTYAIAGIPAIVKSLTYKFHSIVCECSFNYQNQNPFVINAQEQITELQFADAPTSPDVV